MGFFDFFNSPEKRKRGIALEIDLAVGVLERCPVCNSIADKQRDELLADARREAQRRFDAGDPKLALFENNHEELFELLDSVRKPVNYMCDCEDAG